MQYRYKEGSARREYATRRVGWTAYPTPARRPTRTNLTTTPVTFQVARIVDTGAPASVEESARQDLRVVADYGIRPRTRNRIFVPIDLINRGFNLIIEVEYDEELDYSSLPQAFPLMLGSFGGSANSEEELRKMGYKGEPSNTDTNIRYAELVPDRKWVSKSDGSYLEPVTKGKVITYKYTVRWGDLDDDGVSIVRPDTGAVMTFPQKVNGRH